MFFGPSKVGQSAVSPSYSSPPASIVSHFPLTDCHERLARYKVPRSIEVIATLPRSTTGKVLKRELRARESGSA